MKTQLGHFALNKKLKITEQILPVTVSFTFNLLSYSHHMHAETERETLSAPHFVTSPHHRYILQQFSVMVFISGGNMERI